MKGFHTPRERMPALALAAISVVPAAAFGQHGLEEIVVTATPRKQSAAGLAQSVTVVGGRELDRSRAATLGETLEGQLGMSASYFGIGASRPIIRGLAGARVRLMQDGIESMDVSTISADHAVGVDPLVARQIEIFRGPTTLLYGSGAVGGVVNTVTSRIPEIPLEDGLDAALEVRADTVSNERTAALALDGGGGGFAWHADSAKRRTDDYEIPGFADGHEHGDDDAGGRDAGRGVLENSDLDLGSYGLGASWLGSRGLLGLSVSGFETEYGVPHRAHGDNEGGEAAPEGEEHHHDAVRVRLEQQRVDLKGGWAGVSGRIEEINVRLGIGDYEHVELIGNEPATRFVNDAFEARVELLHAPVGRWSGAAGLQIAGREFSATGEEAFIPPVDTETYGAFLIERLELEQWSLSLGGRYEHREHRPTERPSARGSATSFSAAAIRRLGNGYAVALNLASSERLPVAEELYADGPHHASGTIEIGNPRLGKEAARHLDIGIRRSSGALAWSITAFVTDYDDFVLLRDTGVEDAHEHLPIFEYAQRDAEVAGIEAELFTPIATLGRGELDLRLFADYVRGRLDNGENVPRIPPLRYGARLAYHAERFAAGRGGTRHANQDDLAPFEDPTEAYTLVGADFDWRLTTERGTELTFFARATNLLDEDARRHTSLVKRIAPLPGRNVSLGVRAVF